MNAIMKYATPMAAVLILSGAMASSAAAKALDRLNGQLDRPVDHGIAHVANTFVPGSGTAMEISWRGHRSDWDWIYRPRLRCFYYPYFHCFYYPHFHRFHRW